MVPFGPVENRPGGLVKARTLTFAGAVALAIAWAGTGLHAQPATADLVLTNGKIITVDEKFTIAQAVAVRADRIIAVGTTQQINALAGPTTRRIDLKGKAVLPGLIDSHAHLWRAAATWEEELRLDGVDTRKEALAMVAARAKSLTPGE
jgi:predicted amidohydrolase YtcJ